MLCQGTIWPASNQITDSELSNSMLVLTLSPMECELLVCSPMPKVGKDPVNLPGGNNQAWTLAMSET